MLPLQKWFYDWCFIHRQPRKREKAFLTIFWISWILEKRSRFTNLINSQWIRYPFLFDLYTWQHISELNASGKLPIVVGGTHYYIQSLIWNSLLDVNVNYSEEDHDNLEALSTEELYKKLLEVDPDQPHHPNQRKRILSDLRLYQETGVAPSVLRKQQNAKRDNEEQLDNVVIWLSCNEKTLNDRLDHRVFYKAIFERKQPRPGRMASDRPERIHAAVLGRRTPLQWPFGTQSARRGREERAGPREERHTAVRKEVAVEVASNVDKSLGFEIVCWVESNIWFKWTRASWIDGRMLCRDPSRTSWNTCWMELCPMWRWTMRFGSSNLHRWRRRRVEE